MKVGNKELDHVFGDDEEYEDAADEVISNIIHSFTRIVISKYFSIFLQMFNSTKYSNDKMVSGN